MKTMKKTIEMEVELSRLHDCIVEVFYNDDDVDTSNLTEEILEKVFDKLPQDVQFTAYQWGGDDTEFGDAAFRHMKGGKEEFIKIIEQKESEPIGERTDDGIVVEHDKIREVWKKASDAYFNNKKGICPDGPASMIVVDGDIACGKKHGLACVECGSAELTGKVMAQDPETHERFVSNFDFSDMQSFEITGSAGDVVQATIRMYSPNRDKFEIDTFSCPVSRLTIGFDDMRVAECQVSQLRSKETAE
jgi:hypothetical protein